MSDVDDAVEAIRGGGLAIVPTDTVYGLAARADSEAAVRRLYETKGRNAPQPTALMAASIDVLLDCLPELRERERKIVGMLLPGPYTLVLANPATRFAWLTGDTPAAIGVRVPVLGGPGRAVLARIGALAATSANLPGGADPRTLDQVPDELKAAAVVVDGGELPGTASTVIDFTGPKPLVLREGAASSGDALRLVGPVL